MTRRGKPMPTFQCQPLAELARQLLFAPLDKRLEQVRRAERLHDMVEPGSLYPYEFVSFRITGYRSEANDRIVLVGQAVQADLRQLIDLLSRSVCIPLEDEPTLTVDALARRLNVSTKTISRYRQAGLRWRWVMDGARQRVGITRQAVNHFLNTHHDQVQRAGQFTQLSPQTRDKLIRRARRIAQGRDVSLFKVAHHLAQRSGRAVETVRRLLQQHDQANPERPIFVSHRPPLNAREKQVIARAHARGVAVPRLADRFGRTRSTIYRALREVRLERLQQSAITWVHSPLFAHPDAEQVILGPSYDPPQAADCDRPNRPWSDLPAEVAGLFDQPTWPGDICRRVAVRQNYLKFKAHHLRQHVNLYEPRAGDLEQIEQALRQAATLRVKLMLASLPMLLVTARGHLHGQPHRSLSSLVLLLDQGMDVLTDAVEQYDPAREQTLQEYLRWRLLRHYASRLPTPTAQAHRRLSPQQAVDHLQQVTLAKHGLAG